MEADKGGTTAVGLGKLVRGGGKVGSRERRKVPRSGLREGW